MAMMAPTRVLPVLLYNSPMTNAPAMKPNRYPPVGPNRTPNPDDPPENTGRPMIPNITYTVILVPPHLAPNTRPAKRTKKTWRVIGTGLMGRGILIKAPMAVRAANSAA